jgi:hypothetical protein
MRNVFDHLGRSIGLSALTPSGVTVAEDVIAPDARRADLRHEPDPARHEERARLGLLGRMASVLCLIELYSGAPDEDDVLACAGKLIAFRQHRRRATRKKQKEAEKPLGEKPPAAPFVRPFGWIIAVGCPGSVLSSIAAVDAAGWPRGVYFSPGVLSGPGGAVLAGLDGAGGMLRMGIVVASELPRERSTLLVRFMAAGPLLKDAIADLNALPDDADERAVAEQILVDLRDVLGSKPGATAAEEEFIANMSMTFSQARKEARDEGRNEGRTEEAVRNLLTVLRVRGITLPDAARERILAERDPERLERWLERAALAASVDEVLGEPS